MLINDIKQENLFVTQFIYGWLLTWYEKLCIW